ncbi:MAG: Ethyl tert-butyl ether degradation EthD [Sphingomonadales bacterium]|nr:Ethyl tert-butyl ether degradation EthD [Sphingomonadales bacterium]
MKAVAFVRAPTGEDPALYKHWYLHSFAPSLVASVPEIVGLTVNVIRQAEALYEGAGMPPVAEIYAEFWAAPGHRLTAEHIRPTRGTQQVFEVDERIEKAELDRQPGVMPGIRLLSPLHPIDGATREQSIAYWDQHVPLALRVHIGMNRYVRDIVRTVLSEEQTPVFGVASLHFPSDDAIRDRFFDSPDSIPEHAADLARFVGSVVPMSAVAHVLK